MMKTYTARSEICINVRVGERARHLTFIPMTLGGSSFSTDDPALQTAIEHHRFFGKRIKLAKTQDDQPPKSQTAPKPKEVVVYSMSEAKEYVVNNLGISRTKLRTSKQIFSIAQSKGINLILR